MAPPLCYFLAPILVEPLINLCKTKRKLITTLLLSLNVGVFGWLTILGRNISDSSNVSLLFGLVLTQSMLYSAPYARIALVEMTAEGESSPTIIYHMYNFFTLFQCLLSALSYFLIGYSL